ncbi:MULTISPECIES: hypothetical protein [Streptomyces]|uniref:Uncharacterized protein n=1 Tax=Streptomyces griseocarneus TaxID=51201 RepID=A0ABX7RMN6_9ACTN|nr:MULTISPECIES: hypothetical protein [Streptomyces]QSY49549.1 hypothetical protein J3S04_32485 [Streptomyces griseocarneus]
MTKATGPPADQPDVAPICRGRLRDLGAEAFAAIAEAAERCELLGVERFAELLLRAGRLDGPALLFDAWSGETIDARTLAAHVGQVCVEHGRVSRRRPRPPGVALALCIGRLHRQRPTRPAPGAPG